MWLMTSALVFDLDSKQMTKKELQKELKRREREEMRQVRAQHLHRYCEKKEPPLIYCWFPRVSLMRHAVKNSDAAPMRRRR